MMNNYWHMMEQVTLSDRKKEEIMDMLENQGTQKRRKPSVKVLVLAAALAVGCVLSIAAGLPARVYGFMTGGTATFLPGTNQAFWDFTGEEWGDPVTVENGRLWFEADGQKIDITDKVDENTPYIYEHTDPASGEKGYVVVGGTPEDFGWAEIIQMDEATAISGNNFANPDSLSLEDVSIVEIEPNTYVESGYVGKAVDVPANRPWLDAALDQLGLAEYK